MEAAVNILTGLAVLALVGTAVWLLMEIRAAHRRDRQEAAQPDQQASKINGGGGGPPEPP